MAPRTLRSDPNPILALPLKISTVRNRFTKKVILAANFQMPTASWQILAQCKNQRGTVFKDLWRMQVDNSTGNRIKVLRGLPKTVISIVTRGLGSILVAMTATTRETLTSKKAIMGFRQHIRFLRKSRRGSATKMTTSRASRKIRIGVGTPIEKRELTMNIKAITSASLGAGKARLKEKRSLRSLQLIGS